MQSAGDSYGGTLIGGIAGGLFGNQVSSGNGRTLATAVGAVTGAIVGDRVSANSLGYRTVKRCKTVIDYEQVPVYREQVQIVHQPAQVYHEPVRLIQQPVQVYQQPARVVRKPIVVEERDYYSETEERHYRPEHWRHHRHERDED